VKWRNSLGGVLEYSEPQIAEWRRLQALAGRPNTLAAFEEAHGLSFGSHRIKVDPTSMPVRRVRRSSLHMLVASGQTSRGSAATESGQLYGTRRHRAPAVSGHPSNEKGGIT
jgi:hypothetical protein